MTKKAELDLDINKFLAKVKKAEKGESLDLSSDEDLSVAIMNLISIEEHLFFTYNKTHDDKYLDILEEVRGMRKSALKRIIKDYEGEVWCISKHLLAAAMRFMEVGTKSLTKGDKKDAKDMFSKGYQLYSLFWGLNLGMVGSQNIGVMPNSKVDLTSDTPTLKSKGSVSIFDKLGKFVKSAVDCCRE